VKARLVYHSTHEMSDLMKSVGAPSGVRRGVKDPIESHWPPPHLGLVPRAKVVHPQIPVLESIETRTFPDTPLSHKLVEDPADNPLLEIWSARCEQIGDEKYLRLPPGLDGNPSAWHDSHNGKYPSDKIYIRETYEQAFSILLHTARSMEKKMCHLALGGTSGLGKSFFFRYVVWRLLHEVTEGPNTILLRDDPKEPSGYLYHAGSFFTVTSISAFLATNVAANWFNHKNAWIICDGAPPEKYMHCPTLVLSSPGNFQINDANGAKKYFKGAVCKVYLPPWSAKEIWAVAKDIHSLSDEHEDRLLERFRMFGGIPRAVLQNFWQDVKSLESSFVLTDILTALNEVGSDEVNHQKVSGTILHMIPSEDLDQVSYQWGSTLIMETAFSMMFKLTKSKSECFLHGAMGLHLGTFYGLLFEPYFHRRMTEQGYKGKIRKLVRDTSDPLQSLSDTTKPKKDNKRQWYGGKKLVAEVLEHEIPVQSLHHFHIHKDIKEDKYNVPDRKNFAAVDSVAPARGEMYQVTSGELHPVKAHHLRPLKKHYDEYLKKTGQKAKLIFVVPPNRFATFAYQKYTVPEKRAKAIKSHEEDGETQKTSDLTEEVEAWVEQYVMEVNVDPLIATFDRRIESQNRKRFKDAWGTISMKGKK